jgi:hypothetical protein
LADGSHRRLGGHDRPPRWLPLGCGGSRRVQLDPNPDDRADRGIDADLRSGPRDAPAAPTGGEGGDPPARSHHDRGTHHHGTAEGDDDHDGSEGDHDHGQAEGHHDDHPAAEGRGPEGP